MRGHYWDEVTGYDSDEDLNTAAGPGPSAAEIESALEQAGAAYSFQNYLEDQGYLDHVEDMLGMIVSYAKHHRLPLLQRLTLSRWMEFTEASSYDWRPAASCSRIPVPIPITKTQKWERNLVSLGTIPSALPSASSSGAGKKRSTANATSSS